MRRRQLSPFFLAAFALLLVAVVASGCRGLTLPTTQPDLPDSGGVGEILMCTPPACAPGEILVCGEDECPGGCGTICATPTSQPIIMCTPPACAPGEVLVCGEDECPGGCGTICAAPTPEPIIMCTPPACAPGEVLVCGEDECPGGCGTICAAPGEADDLTDSQAGGGGPLDTGLGGTTAVPTDWESLEVWLTEQWLSDANPAAVRAALQASGWQRDFNDWLSADLDGDLRDEWVVILHDTSLPSAPFGDPGNLWVVNGNGIVFRYYPEPSSDIYEFLAPEIVGLADMTGDGLPELVTNAEVCGAHTCYGNYRVIGFAGDLYADAVSREPLGEGDPTNVISLSYPTVQLEDLEQDGTTELLINGGTIGSVGAGIVRPRTEIWSWDGSAVTLADTQLDPTDYRHHVLYEANDLMAGGDLEGAVLLYEAAITDDSLRNDAFPAHTPEAIYDAIAQFAAFRLAVIDLLQGQAETAQGRLSWLQTNHPGSAATQAAGILLANWTGTESLDAVCPQIEAALSGLENPTGPLADLGYGNPSLQAIDLCP